MHQAPRLWIAKLVDCLIGGWRDHWMIDYGLMNHRVDEFTNE
jgi:hypothetical protein